MEDYLLRNMILFGPDDLDGSQMTEVAMLPPSYPPPPPPGMEQVAMKRYEGVVSMDNYGLVEPDDTVESTKEEEWVTKRTTELTTTRQIETRVKRQVVLEDGEVVEDSGPVVSTNTTEDTEKQEHETTEHRTLGDPTDDATTAVTDAATAGSGSTMEVGVGKGKITSKDVVDHALPVGGSLVREVKEKRVLSREEKDELVETEDIRHLGDFTDEAYIAAVKTGAKDLRPALLAAEEDIQALLPSGPRVVQQTTKSKKTVDTEDTELKTSAQPDGKIVTEKKRTTEHEEILDEDLPADEAGSLDSGSHEHHTSATQRLKKTRDTQAVHYVADGKLVGTEMRYVGETQEAEREGGAMGRDAQDWESLSDRMRRARRQQHGRTLLQRQKEAAAAIDRKDALTKRPLDFDAEEETRKVETSKWLENHFGSDSRSSKSSITDGEEPAPERKTQESFFNVTIKNQPVLIHEEPTRGPNMHDKSHLMKTMSSPSKVYVPQTELEQDRSPPMATKGYFQGVSEWSERKVVPPKTRSPPIRSEKIYTPDYGRIQEKRLTKHSEIQRDDSAYVSSSTFYTAPGRSPEIPDRASDLPDRVITPTIPRYMEEERPEPPQRKRALERRMRSSEESGYRTNLSRESREEEPAPDYSPPPRRASPSPNRAEVVMNGGNKKSYQRTRFATEPSPPQKHPSVGAVIGQSIRKLVGKIRSASAERKNKLKAKRSPSPQKPLSPTNSHQSGGSTYQQYNNIDSHISGSGLSGDTYRERDPRTKRERDSDLSRGPSSDLGMAVSPVHRYYLGEDPYGGSIYGKENKYDGVKPQRTSSRSHHRPHEEIQHQDYRSQQQQTTATTLGRYNKSSNRSVLTPTAAIRSAQTLPRKLHNEPPQRTGSTINVSIINTVAGPAKPARTYKSLNRSKSFNVTAGQGRTDPSTTLNRITARNHSNVYKSNPHLNDSAPQLKSPGIVSLISRSQRDLTSIKDEDSYSPRYKYTNGHVDHTDYANHANSDKRTVFLKSLQDRAPELFKTLHGEETIQRATSPSPRKEHNINSLHRHRNGTESPISTVHKTEIYSPVHNVIRRGSGSTDDYSETYRMTSKSDDPKRPSVTNTVQSFTKRTLPAKDGRAGATETIESTETKTVTTSRYRGDPTSDYRRVDTGNRNKRGSSSGGVVIEVRNSRK